MIFFDFGKAEKLFFRFSEFFGVLCLVVLRKVVIMGLDFLSFRKN
jgi:hypothetical protein